MDYLLTILTNGRVDCLERSWLAFKKFVQPQPKLTYVYDDSETRLGMCAAYTKCWQAAAESEYEWVFHLEDDFLILRPVDLEPMRAVIDETRAEQMALVRCPWGREIEWGGYIPHMPGLYDRELSDWGEWISTQRNWATNPALFPTTLTREFPWDPHPGCETEIGPRIIESRPDAVFGLWGWGEPWAAHIGVERAEGAHGY